MAQGANWRGPAFLQRVRPPSPQAGEYGSWETLRSRGTRGRDRSYESRHPNIGRSPYPGCPCMGICTCLCGCGEAVPGWRRACEGCQGGRHNRTPGSGSQPAASDGGGPAGPDVPGAPGGMRRLGGATVHIAQSVHPQRGRYARPFY